MSAIHGKWKKKQGEKLIKNICQKILWEENTTNRIGNKLF